tara:strand:+ start:12459 stop:13106 length:648 start_codon:yes stop_codon:yes gene_type:complete
MTLIENPEQLTQVTAIFAGLALSAAAGLRVFLPLLALAVASRMGYVDLGNQFEWLSNPMILLVLGTATVVEVASYYLPWVDNLLDTVATPAAIGSGTLIATALLPEMNSALQWGLGLLLGGGPAAVVQGTTVVTRGASTATSGGLANPIVATAETGGSIAVAGLAFVVPLLIGVLVIFVVGYLLIRIVRFLFRRRRSSTGAYNDPREDSSQPPQS